MSNHHVCLRISHRGGEVCASGSASGGLITSASELATLNHEDIPKAKGHDVDISSSGYGGTVLGCA
eukprot:4454459-Pleurochrysis_carterae.AAC.1